MVYYLFLSSSTGATGLNAVCVFSVTIALAKVKVTTFSVLRDELPILTLYSPASAIQADLSVWKEAKSAAVRANGTLGGRPKKVRVA